MAKNVNLDDMLHRRLKMAAALRGQSLSSLIHEILSQMLDALDIPAAIDAADLNAPARPPLPTIRPASGITSPYPGMRRLDQ